MGSGSICLDGQKTNSGLLIWHGDQPAIDGILKRNPLNLNSEIGY